VEVAGPMELQVPWQIVSILPEIEHGLIWLYPLKSSLTALLEEAVMVVMLLKSINLHIGMEFHNKLVKLIKPKIHIYLVAPLYRIVWTALHQEDKNQGIREIVGHNKNIQFGKRLNLG
jgi:hypothetical protein